MFFDNVKKMPCEKCGYVVTYTKVIPQACPQCGIPLNIQEQELASSKNDNELKTNLASLIDDLPDGTAKVDNNDLFSGMLDQTRRETRKRFRDERKDHQEKKKGIQSIMSNIPPSIAEELRAQESESKPKISQEDIVLSKELEESKTKQIKNIEISKSSITSSNIRVKVKKTEKAEIDLDKFAIMLNDKYNEYLKFLGIITLNRTEIFASNERFRYLLELGSNLNYIATSILSGELDRMQLTSPETGVEETVFFKCDQEAIYVAFGNFPDKKANWILNQLKINLKDLIKSQNMDELTKMDLYNLDQSLEKRVRFFLNEYVNLQDVFTDNKILTVDQFLRVDYFGLSYQSIGVISKMLTSILDIQGLPPVDPNDPSAEESIAELRESLITAKVEAMAANTVANTAMMPNWISVKLSFQKYRYLIFSKIQDYFISLLAEGNLDYREGLLKHLEVHLSEVTQKPFMGDLMSFQKVTPQVLSTIQQNNSEQNQNSTN